jgi:6 kDa early secretory antigenic target
MGQDVTTFQVDSEAVIGATATVRSSIGRIQAEVNSLHSQLTNLQGSWSGQAATAFQGVIAEWRSTQQRVEEGLESINQALTHAGQQYLDIEQANARLFSH